MSNTSTYLNYASTNPSYTGRFNYSDLAYGENMVLRKDIDTMEDKIKQLVNAPKSAKVIVNSGATESIANCILWAKSYNPYGIVLGTNYDHSAVKDNCDNYGIAYQEMRNNAINDKCSMIFLTHVNSKNGEVMDVERFTRILETYYFGNNVLGTNTLPSIYSSHVLQYKPLLVLDATQSIMRVPIDMSGWKLNALFFSLHKIGGPAGVGVFVINDTQEAPFKPLIAGKQQHGFRGGTMPMIDLVEYSYIFDNFDDFNTRKSKWNDTYKKLKGAGFNVYKPKSKHLYNTFLISTGTNCPLGYINELAKNGIYIGNTSACKNEEIADAKSKNVKVKKVEGGNIDPFENAVRISFKSSNEINDEVVDKIVQVLRLPVE